MASSENIPVTCIRPLKGWLTLNLRELWEARELLYFFTWRDIKVRYKQTLLGIGWALLVPLANTLVFTLIFGKLARLPTNDLPPAVFYMAGLVIWRYFATSLTMSSDSLIRSANMLTKIYFPRIMVPFSACLTGLIDLCVATCGLFVLMLCYGTLPAASAALLPLLILMALGTALGVGLVFSALNVRFRDVRYMVPFIVQIWMYCSVILPFSKIPQRFGGWRYLYGLNPMGGVVEGFRWCLLHLKMSTSIAGDPVPHSRVIPETVSQGQLFHVNVLDDRTTEVVLQQITRVPVEPPWLLIAIGLPVTLLLLTFGLYYFRRVENQFADII